MWIRLVVHYIIHSCPYSWCSSVWILCQVNHTKRELHNVLIQKLYRWFMPLAFYAWLVWCHLHLFNWPWMRHPMWPQWSGYEYDRTLQFFIFFGCWTERIYSKRCCGNLERWQSRESAPGRLSKFFNRLSRWVFWTSVARFLMPKAYWNCLWYKFGCRSQTDLIRPCLIWLIQSSTVLWDDFRCSISIPIISQNGNIVCPLLHKEALNLS